MQTQIKLTDEGFLTNFKDWTPEFAMDAAKADDILLNDDHWTLINFIRNYFHYHHFAPPVGLLLSVIRKEIDPKKGTRDYLLSLFPSGPTKQACRYAGLPSSLGCI